MNRGILIGLGAVLAVIVVVGYASMFTVHQASQALVLQFGEPRAVVTDPGLHFKLPFVQTVTYFDRRVLEFDAPKEEVIASDQKRLVVDAFALPHRRSAEVFPDGGHRSDRAHAAGGDHQRQYPPGPGQRAAQ